MFIIGSPGKTSSVPGATNFSDLCWAVAWNISGRCLEFDVLSVSKGLPLGVWRLHGKCLEFV